MARLRSKVPGTPRMRSWVSAQEPSRLMDMALHARLHETVDDTFGEQGGVTAGETAVGIPRPRAWAMRSKSRRRLRTSPSREHEDGAGTAELGHLVHQAHPPRRGPVRPAGDRQWRSRGSDGIRGRRTSWSPRRPGWASHPCSSSWNRRLLLQGLGRRAEGMTRTITDSLGRTHLVGNRKASGGASRSEKSSPVSPRTSVMPCRAAKVRPVDASR